MLKYLLPFDTARVTREIELLHVEGTKETPDTNQAVVETDGGENLKKKGNEKF